MKQVDLTLKGVTISFANGSYDQLFVTMAVCSCINHNENDAQTDFPVPPLVTVDIEPYRLVVPLNDKHALITRGSEVEFRVSGEKMKAKVVKVKERESCSCQDFVASLENNPE